MSTHNCRLCVLIVALLWTGVSRGQPVGELAVEVVELTAKLAAYSGDYRAMAESGVLAIGKDIAEDVAKDKAKEIAIQVATGDFAEEVKAIYEDAEKAKDLVKAVNAKLPDAPDFSGLDYCAQAQASSDEIAKIDTTIKDLEKLAGQAASYKRLLVPLDKVKTGLGNFFGQLVGLDVVLEHTTYGTIAQQWDFLTFNADAASSGDPNANYLMSNSKTDWDFVEAQAKAKASQLTQTLAARKAFHEHFYSAAEQKCSDDKARTAALASFGGLMPLGLPNASSGLGTAANQCQAAAQNAAAFLSSCMRVQASACGNFRTTASCYSQAATQCGACGTCSSPLQSAAAQARVGAQQICAN